MSAYIGRHGNLSRVQQGLFTQAFTPHEVAYHEMTTALSRFRGLTRNAATQVNIAQVEYSREELRAARDLDVTRPGRGGP
ncbi:hypothetical protein [Actinoplanes derwentensis]|uniref:Uncharacterized protein n=1 Tax=Actinoplanes derwentensis TaxID=113562 RepID=A0A1H1Q340_9ACTN|nr:hypothetical protein [Actinoplanes derwentensis]SDS17409.1 hypothetical protein SAMN04489716_0183 [Actinoplanes derwentensis]